MDATTGASESARAILQHMKNTKPISRERVREAFAPHLSFFSGYMENVSGVLDKAIAIPDSDDEGDWREPIGEVILEMPWNDDIAAPAAIIEDDGNNKEGDEEGNSDLPAVVLHGLVRRSETSVRLCSTFLQCHIGSVSKLLLAALHGNEQLREAITWHSRGQNGAALPVLGVVSRDVRMDPALARAGSVWSKSRSRARGVSFPLCRARNRIYLGCFGRRGDRVSFFPEKSLGGSSQYNGSAYFYRYGNKDRREDQTPWAYAESSVWMVILPKAVVAALTCTALKYVERKAAATKYWICIPMWLEEKWEYYHTVVEEAERRGEAKGKRQREEGANCLHLTPYSADKYTT